MIEQPENEKKIGPSILNMAGLWRTKIVKDNNA